jgi:hypothetical protein
MEKVAVQEEYAKHDENNDRARVYVLAPAHGKPSLEPVKIIDRFLYLRLDGGHTRTLILSRHAAES